MYIDWKNEKIHILKSDLTLVSGTLYKLDTNWFRLQLDALSASEEGIPFLRTHRHNTEVTVAGVTYARTIEIINGYSIEFEDGQYSVRLEGSNNNIFDIENNVLVQNQVQVIPTNSAGLITVTSGSGVTAQDKTDIIKGVWDELLSLHTVAGSTGNMMDTIWQMLGGKREIVNNQEIFYEDDNTTEVARYNLFDKNGTPTETNVYKREKV